jgi:hypothetical protein
MPFVFNPQPIRVIVSYLDDSGGTSDAWINVPYGSTRAEAEAFALALIQAAEPITDCQITKVTLVVQLRPEYDPPALPDSDATRTGAFIFADATNERTIVTVPGIVPAKISTIGALAGIAIDLTDADISALVDLVVIGDGTLEPVSWAGNDLIELRTAYLQHRD